MVYEEYGRKDRYKDVHVRTNTAKTKEAENDGKGYFRKIYPLT